MEPITQDQEWTLKNWVATLGRRPGKLEKAFLQREKGLSEQQIDCWLENAELNSSCEVIEDPILPQGSINGAASAEDASLLCNLDFNTLNENLIDMLPIEEAQSWSPITQLQNTYPFGDNIDGSDHIEPWQSIGSYSGELDLTTTLPHMERKSGNSELFNNHWTYMSDVSSRSSGISYASSRTWDTASTAASFVELYSDGTEEQNNLKEERHSLSKQPRRSHSRHPSSSFDCRTIPEEASPCTCHKTQTAPSVSSTRGTHTVHVKTTNKPLPKAEKVPVKYPCTACSCVFGRRWEWKRHEESQHDQQTYWICMLGDPAIQTTSGWTCVFCEATIVDRFEMAVHLQKEHKINQCISKHSGDKTFRREDKLKQHLQKVHSLSETSTRWKAWQHPAVKKAAWGCGYCGACSFTWEGRISHIAEHYESESFSGTKWNMSLVIKGLLKQIQPEFNVAKAWRDLVGRAPNRDRQLVWSEKDAIILKRKLEFHEGTPQDIAREARKLARSPYGHALQMWIDADSKSDNTLPISSSELARRGVVSRSRSNSDYEMSDAMSNRI